MNKITKALNSIWLLYIFAAIPLFGQQNNISAVRDGIPEYEIVLCEKAIPAETKAAEELRKYLKKSTGVLLNIATSEKSRPGGRKIYIGPGNHVKSLFKNIDWNSMEPDRVILKNDNGDLILAGGRPRGTLYAVYTFLENVVGCRWWTSSEEFIPKLDNILISGLDLDYTPKLTDFRMTYYWDVNQHPEFAAKIKSHGFYQKIKVHPELGGGLSVVPRPAHTYFHLISPRKYFKDHPDWYSLNKNSKRITGQLCESNQEMWKEAVKVCERILAKVQPPRFIAVSPLDGDGRKRCFCPKCLKTARNENAYSANMVKFTNYLAENVATSFPNAKIVVFPYEYTQKPPTKIKCAPNITILFCTSRFAMNNPAYSKSNLSRLKFFDDWRRLNPRNDFWVWDYNAVFRDYLQPFPNYSVAAKNIDYFVKHGVKGIFIQGDGHCNIGDFVGLRTWIIAKKLWNPALKYDDLENEYLTGYYGKAAPFLKQYLRLMENAAKRDSWTLNLVEKSMGFLDEKTLEQGAMLFAKAINAVKNNKALHDRVQREKIPLLYATLKLSVRKDISSRNILPCLGYSNRQEALKGLKQLFEIWKPYQVTEARNPKYYTEVLDLLEAETPKGPKNIKSEQWYDFQELDVQLYGRTKIEKDQSASNGLAVKLKGNHRTWLAQYRVGKRVPKADNYTLNVVVRCDISNNLSKDAPVFQFGFYCPGVKTESKTIYRRDIPDDKYRTFDMPIRSAMESSKYTPDKSRIWIMPLGKDNKIKNIFVDRFYIKTNK